VDPYVVLTCGDSKRRTKVKKGCYSPVWEEEFVFKGVAEDDVILFEVSLCGMQHIYHET
jgi:Ca2+-dependent lipid-binding protein